MSSNLFQSILSHANNLTCAENPDNIHSFHNTTCFNKSILPGLAHVAENQPIYGFYEHNGQFRYGLSPDFDKKLINKHDLPVHDQIGDILSETAHLTAANPSFLNLKDKNAFLKRLATSYFETSLVDVCQEIIAYQTQTTNPSQKLPNYITNAAHFVLKFSQVINAPINPWLISKKEQELSFRSIKGVEWSSCVIKSFEWHPHMTKYAIAFKNDLVKVYSHNNHQPVILKHPKQINVTCLAWKPFYSSLIAIGCADCIIIWDTDALPVSIKPASSCSFVLSKRYHSDIMDLQWYPKSDYLISVASKDNQILVWDVAMKTCAPIKSVETSGFSFSRFSPNGQKLFTASMSTSFRIWNPVNYTSEKWTNLTERCNSACWSPDETFLLFSCQDCSLLYVLKFLSNSKQEIDIVGDLSSVNTRADYSMNETVSNRFSFGGAIYNMAWDQTGQRLAVSFKKYDVDTQVNGVAIFSTKLYPQFQVLPLGFITDSENAWPLSIQFKPQFKEGALLSIAWSSGRIQHVPLYFTQLNETYPAVSNLTCF